MKKNNDTGKESKYVKKSNHTIYELKMLYISAPLLKKGVTE